jgi:AraC-like DNA-binding protein
MRYVKKSQTNHRFENMPEHSCLAPPGGTTMRKSRIVPAPASLYGKANSPLPVTDQFNFGQSLTSRSPRERPDQHTVPARPIHLRQDLGEREFRIELLAQLPADGGESLNRLCNIVSQAGFNVLFYDENANTVGSNSTAPTFATGGLTPRALQRVGDYIMAHLAENIELQALADIAGLSRFHFARMFKQSAGTPPHHYLMQRRLERAQKLLAESNLSIAQIALESGFSDQSHFTHRFRLHFGITPRSFRRSRR